MILDARFSFFFYLSSSSFFSPIAPLNFYFFHIFYDLYCAFYICMLFSPFVPPTIFWFKVDILQNPPSFLTSLLCYYSLVLPCCSPTYSLIYLIFFTFFEAQTIHLLHSFFFFYERSCDCLGFSFHSTYPLSKILLGIFSPFILINLLCTLQCQVIKDTVSIHPYDHRLGVPGDGDKWSGDLEWWIWMGVIVDVLMYVTVECSCILTFKCKFEWS